MTVSLLSWHMRTEIRLRQALEGAPGSAGRTESTSTTEQAVPLTVSFGPDADHGVTKGTSWLIFLPGPT